MVTLSEKQSIIVLTSDQEASKHSDLVIASLLITYGLSVIPSLTFYRRGNRALKFYSS